MKVIQSSVQKVFLLNFQSLSKKENSGTNEATTLSGSRKFLCRISVYADKNSKKNAISEKLIVV